MTLRTLSKQNELSELDFKKFPDTSCKKRACGDKRASARNEERPSLRG